MALIETNALITPDEMKELIARHSFKPIEEQEKQLREAKIIKLISMAAYIKLGLQK